MGRKARGYANGYQKFRERTNRFGSLSQCALSPEVTKLLSRFIIEDPYHESAQRPSRHRKWLESQLVKVPRRRRTGSCG
jgi:hypothetical protein